MGRNPILAVECTPAVRKQANPESVLVGLLAGAEIHDRRSGPLRPLATSQVGNRKQGLADVLGSITQSIGKLRARTAQRFDHLSGA